MPINALVGSALVSGGSDLLSNLLGWKSNKDTNKTNYDIAQMNNQFNERMLQKEMDYNTQMWHMQNDYNTPSSQRARYEAAGINPYMALGNIQSGQAGSVGGVKTPSAQPVTMQPFQPDFSGIGQAAQNYFANRLAEKRNDAAIAVDDEKASQLRIENQYKAAELVTQIMERIQKTHDIKAKRMYQQIMNNYADEMFGSDIKVKQRQADSIEADVKAKNVDTALKELQLAGFPQQFQMQLAAMSADILLKSEQTKMTKQQTVHEIQKMFKTFAETSGIKINNRILERSADSIVDKAKYDVFKGHTLQSTAAGIGYTIGKLLK